MAGILAWATDTIASVTSTIVSPFLSGDPGPEVPESRVNYKPKKSKAKKKEAAKRKLKATAAARARQDSTDNGEEDDVEEEGKAVGPSLSVNSAAAEVGRKGRSRKGEAISFEPDEHTKRVLAKMAAAAEAREREEAEAAEKKKAAAARRARLLENSVVKTLPEDPLAAERAELTDYVATKLQEIGTGEKLRLEELQARIGDMIDALDELRDHVEDVSKNLSRKCGKIPVDKQQMTVDDLRKAIQEIELSIFSSGREDDAASVEEGEEGEEGEDDEYEDEDEDEQMYRGSSGTVHRRTRVAGNEAEVQNLLGVLKCLISQQNNNSFQERVADMVLNISQQKTRLNANLERARDQEVRLRAIDRLQGLLEALSISEGDGSPNAVHRKAPPQLDSEKVHEGELELTVDYGRIAPHVRKIERKFHCVLTPPSNRARRLLRVWGYEEDLDRCLDWLSACDWTGQQNKQFDKKLASVIVGRGGSTIQSLENQFDCFLNFDNGVLTVFGEPNSAEQVWLAVTELQKHQLSTARVTFDIPIDHRLARALNTQFRARISEIENEFKPADKTASQPGASKGTTAKATGKQDGAGKLAAKPATKQEAPEKQSAKEGGKEEGPGRKEDAAPAAAEDKVVRITVISGQADQRAGSDRTKAGTGSRGGRIVVRCLADVRERAKAAVEALVNEFEIIVMPAVTARVVSRLVIPPQSRTGRALFNDFREFRRKHNVFCMTEGDEEGNESSGSRLVIVCQKSIAREVEREVKEFLEKAEFVVERISIMREQQRIFNAENRRLIEESSGKCQVSVVFNEDQMVPEINLVGTPAQVEKAKEIISEILVREGCVQTVDDLSDAVIELLMRERASQLRALENEHAVSIHLHRPTSSAKVVGEQSSIARCIESLHRMQEEIDSESMRLFIKINADCVPLLIGRGGATIQEIRSMPGIHSVEVPDTKRTSAGEQAVVDDIVEVKIFGKVDAVEQAQQFIADLINNSSTGGRRRVLEDSNTALAKPSFSTNAGGRGRGRRPAARQSNTETVSTNKADLSCILLEEGAFPALGEQTAYADA